MPVDKMKANYYGHRANARRNNTSTELTYAQWLKIWEDSGHLHERGNMSGDYCMARIDTEVPFSVENVQIIPIVGHRKARFASMATFNWMEFFNEHQIPYVSSGPNVSRSWHIAIHCPWCGAADKSQHLAMRTDGRGFKCWRNANHGGSDPAKLIQVLLRCSFEQANSLSGNDTQLLPSDFLSKVKATFEEIKPSIPPWRRTLERPDEFKFITCKPSARAFVEYLRVKRGFDDLDIFTAKDCGIMYAPRGEYKGRIMFMVYYKQNLVGWTGRTIYDSNVVPNRYKTLSTDPKKEAYPALEPLTNYLLFYDILMRSRAETIVMCEGPFDAWRVNALGKDLGIVATCFFTSSMSSSQLELLHGLLPRFKNKVLLLDRGTFAKTQMVKNKLATLGVVSRDLETVKDPGEIRTPNELKNVLAIG